MHAGRLRYWLLKLDKTGDYLQTSVVPDVVQWYT